MKIRKEIKDNYFMSLQNSFFFILEVAEHTEQKIHLEAD